MGEGRGPGPQVDTIPAGSGGAAGRGLGRAGDPATVPSPRPGRPPPHPGVQARLLHSPRWTHWTPGQAPLR